MDPTVMTSPRPLLPRILAKGVSKTCKVLRSGTKVMEICLAATVTSTKGGTLFCLRAFDRAAMSLLLTTANEQNNLLPLISGGVVDATLLMSTGISVSFQFAESLTSHFFYLSNCAINGVDVVFGNTESSQRLSQGLDVVSKEIFQDVPWPKLVYALGIFAMLQGTASRAEFLELKWKCTIRNGRCVDLDYRYSDQNGEELMNCLNRLAKEASELGEAVPFVMEIVENTTRQTSFTSSASTKKWNENVVATKRQFGVITPGAINGDFAFPTICQPGMCQDDFRNLKLLCKYRRHQSASYGRTFLHYTGLATSILGYDEQAAFARHIGVSPENVITSSYASGANLYRFSSSPIIYYVTVEESNVVVTLRGTFDLQDVITDAMCQYSEFVWQGKKYKAHSGMLRCAQLVLQSDLMVTLRELLTSHQGYSLTFCGHSLGAGVGALVTILLSKQVENGEFETGDGVPIPAGTKIRCFSYAPPATICPNLSDATSGLITSVVFGDDIVPHLSLGLLWDLKGIVNSLDQSGPVTKQIYDHFLGERPITSKYHMAKLREALTSEKLMPPGLIYRLDQVISLQHDCYPDADRMYVNDALKQNLLPSQDIFFGKVIKQVRVSEIVNKPKYFNEPTFSSTMFHHGAMYYDDALASLDRSFNTVREENIL